MIYRSRTRKIYNLEQVPFAQGGEGKIYYVIGTPNVVAKINKPGIISAKKQKLIVMVNTSPIKKVMS